MRQSLSPSTSRSGGRWRLRDGCAVAALIALSGLAALTGLPAADASRRQELAAVFPPWTSSAEAMASSFAAGMRVLRTGSLPFVMIVASE
uniref:hypothetical protein n=1 Tax=Bosea sp. (in: a-proteobacteria) TaxID=1871050 RepID=UPI002FCBCA4E